MLLTTVERGTAYVTLLTQPVAHSPPLMTARPDERVVLEIGSRVCRAGMSGEAAPRALFDVAQAASRVLGRRVDALYEPNWMLAENARALQEKRRDLVRCLVRILRSVYQEYVARLTQGAFVRCTDVSCAAGT